MAAPKSDRILVAYRKNAPKGKVRIIGRLIRFWSRKRDRIKTKYSHTELIFPEDGISFSSSGYDDGVRFKHIKYSHREWWDFVDVPWIDTKKKIQSVRDWCTSQVGKKYDYRGVFGWIILPFRRQRDDCWWCSEICANAIWMNPFRILPGKMYRNHTRMGGVKL